MVSNTKSQQKDNIARTSCKECVCAIYDGNTQTGCIAGRVDKIANKFEAYDEDKEFYVIEQLCNYYRDNKEEYVKYGSTNIKKIQDESKLSFLIYIIIDSNIEKSQLIKILDEVENTIVNYGESKITAHICYQKNLDSESKSLLRNKIISTKSLKGIIYVNKKFLHTNTMKTTKSFHMIFNTETVKNIDCIFNINSMVNDNLEKFLFLNYKGVQTVSNLAYKIISLQESEINYENNIKRIIEDAKQKKLFKEET